MKRYPLYQAVDSALVETWLKFGLDLEVISDYNILYDEYKEAASRFDLEKAIKDALQAKKDKEMC